MLEVIFSIAGQATVVCIQTKRIVWLEYLGEHSRNRGLPEKTFLSALINIMLLFLLSPHTACACILKDILAAS